MCCKGKVIKKVYLKIENILHDYGESDSHDQYDSGQFKKFFSFIQRVQKVFEMNP